MKSFGGPALFLDRSDINTDEIIPAKYLTEITKEDLKPYLLEDLKLDGFDPKSPKTTGAGVVVNRQVLTGPNAIAGEWGHNPLPWPRDDERPGTDCYCGKQGCIETFLSGPGLERDFWLATGEKLNAAEIVLRATNNETQAEQCLQRYENRMARSLAHIINVLDPHVIVLGGGMSNVQRLYKNVPAIWGQHVFSDSVLTQLLPPKFGDTSGVRGAAWLWNE